MELTVDDIRSMIGGYVLELIGKDKEIAKLKAEIEKLKGNQEATVRDFPKQVGGE